MRSSHTFTNGAAAAYVFGQEDFSHTAFNDSDQNGQPGNQQPEQPGVWSFGSQSTYILPNPKYSPGSDLAPFIYMADRWTPDNNVSFGTYVWLPLFIDPTNVSHVKVVWHASWRLDNATSPFTRPRVARVAGPLRDTHVDGHRP